MTRTNARSEMLDAWWKQESIDAAMVMVSLVFPLRIREVGLLETWWKKERAEPTSSALLLAREKRGLIAVCRCGLNGKPMRRVVLSSSGAAFFQLEVRDVLLQALGS
jgi:hypothetical protein